jgi:CheY-like chemotaxis protein
MNVPLSPLIHLIDDDDAVRDGLSLLIGTVGLRVQTWADPQEFMRSFDRQSIGAIVLDVRMPGTSGLTVLDTLVAQGVDQPVIMLTGHGTVECVPAGLQIGCRRVSGKAGGRRGAARSPAKRRAPACALARAPPGQPAGARALRAAVRARARGAGPHCGRPDQQGNWAARWACRRARWKPTAPTCLPSCMWTHWPT